MRMREELLRRQVGRKDAIWIMIRLAFRVGAALLLALEARRMPTGSQGM
jgi:hypothetical protein